MTMRQVFKQPLLRRRLMALGVVLLAAGAGLAMADVQVSVEDVVNRVDVIALGRVTESDAEASQVGAAKQLLTRHTFEVEKYYKGSGPEKIDIYTHGGYWTDPNGRVHWLSVTHVAGVRKGEELLVFLRGIEGSNGYWIPVTDGGRYEVKTDQETGERSVMLRFRKKKYMRGEALEWFQKIEPMDRDPNAPARAVLPFGKFMTERIPIKELPERLGEVVKGEALPLP